MARRPIARRSDPAPVPAGPGGAAVPGDGSGLRALLPYLRELRHHRRDFLLVNLLMVASIGFSLAIPLQAGRFVDALGGRLPDADRAAALGAVAALLVAQLAGTYLSTIVSSRLDLAYISRLRRRVFGHLLELPSLCYGDHHGGDLSTRVTSDVGSVTYIATSGTVSLARAVIALAGSVWLMLRLNPRLTLVIVAVVPATMLLVHAFGRRLHRLSREMYDELGRISDHVQEVAGAIRVIKSYNSQDHEAARFGAKVEAYRRAGLRRATLSAALESGAQILMWIALIVVVVYGFTMAARGATSQGQLVAFFLLAYRVAVPVSSLTSLYGSAQGAVAATARLDGVLAIPAERRRPGSPRPRFACRGELALEGVRFAYGDREVLHGLDLRVAAGEKVGIVGPSGAGKTTLTGLLLRLFEPAAGRLLLDGRPYAEYDLTDLRGQIAYVSQEPVLYDLSIGENIRFGLDDVTDAQVRAAAARANALDFIERLPQGFATPCGERGQKLSGGERQRITLARAFLRDPRILLLDEPTSALDARAEEAVRAALRALMEGRTAIVIAHRLSTVRDLDRIVVLAEGRVVEAGGHDALVARGGLYAQLHALQHGERGAAGPGGGA